MKSIIEKLIDKCCQEAISCKPEISRQEIISRFNLNRSRFKKKDKWISELKKENKKLRNIVINCTNADINYISSLEKQIEEMKKYEAFWEWSRMADKMIFETYHWKKD